MPAADIRPIKAGLREKYKQIRRTMPTVQKSALDKRISDRVTGLWQYRQCNLLLTYVSTEIEVDTRDIIRRALVDGKNVAVPRCVEGTRNMRFYLINGLHELAPGAFGVLEPNPQTSQPIDVFENSLCIVPALCYDSKGYRLGYGKGYYDRFLSGYDMTAIGIAYSSCVCRKLPHGRFDRPVELVVTENYVRKVKFTRKAW